jgi:hypothetical protein
MRKEGIKYAIGSRIGRGSVGLRLDWPWHIAEPL